MSTESQLHTEMKRLAPMGQNVSPPSYREMAILNEAIRQAKAAMKYERAGE